MMSSVIPARLQFQCGHAALVTLPRIKGESSAQRNQRIAREKSAALARQCDFCGPAVEVAMSASDEVNNSHMLAAELTAPEVETVVVEPLVVVEEPVVVVEEPVVVIVEEPIIVVEEPIIVVEEEPVVVIAEVLAEAVVTQPEKTHTNGKVVLKQTRQRRSAPARREVVTSQPTERREFVVEYRTERVLKAADIRDAMRQVTALGAVNILAATREN